MIRSIRLNRIAAIAYNRAFSTAPENTIRLVFVDREGNRAIVPARVGKSLLDAANMHQVDIEAPCEGGGAPVEVIRTPNWTETTFGEGPTCFLCHVQIPTKYSHLLPPSSHVEVNGLKEIWEEEYTNTSRLACQITLEKKHDGMVVFVPDAPPADMI